MSDEDVKSICLEDPLPEPPKAPEPPKPWEAHWQALGADTFTTAPPNRDWLFTTKGRATDGVFPVGRVGLMNAEGGAGKTMALVQLAIAVATQSDWLGAFRVPTAGRVLLVLGEEDAEEIRRRLYNAKLAIPRFDTRAALDRITTLPLQGVPCAMVENDKFSGNVVDAPFLSWLRGKLAPPGEQWRLIVVDPLSRFAGLDAEKDNAAATRFVQALESIATQTGAAVLVAHHTNKGARGAGAEASTSAARGSSAITDGVRWACFLGVERFDTSDTTAGAGLERVATLTVTKSNYAKMPPPVSMKYSDHGGALLPLTEDDWKFVNEERAKAENNEERRQNAVTRAKNAETNAQKEARIAAAKAEKLAKGAV